MPQPTTNNLGWWEERFIKEFIGDLSKVNGGGEDNLTTLVNPFKVIKFIKSLRKRDEMELIKKINRKYFGLEPLIQLIKDYYNKI